MKLLKIISLLIITASCTTRQATNSIDLSAKDIDLKYAEGFTINETQNYKEITVLNPWKKGKVHSKYYLVKDDNTAVPSDGKKIIIPLKSLVVNSATYLEFLQLLNVLDKVTGVCNAEYIYNPYILNKVKEGKIKDIGDAFNIDVENLLMLRPQAVMTPAYNTEDENTKRLEQTGLSLLYNIEWQEKTPLGRAEWIKFIGAFFDKSSLADSIFNTIEKKYNDIKGQVALLSYAPSVMSGQDFRGTWSMPGGNSFNAHLFQHAGANYFYSNDNSSGSISTNIENVLINFRNADIWVGAQANTLEELGKIDSKYKLFKAYKDGNVYNYNKRINSNYGNDYWESAVAHPDILLADMVKVFHPNLFPNHEFFYIKKLE